jgi:hypothetical protein
MGKEARFLRVCAVAVVTLVSLGANRSYVSVRSQHFIVSAPTAQLAQEICQAAEQYRRDLAIEWLGRELPPWQTPCPIKADVAPGLGAGGATSFVFRNNRPGDWTMQIQGSRERILDSVLPHEITHTIFATHFGRPLPRWADEGACTTVEHAAEKAKQDKFLIDFLTSEPPRSIPFNRMFQMTDYPRDILPLYSQGYSLARFFIQQGGKRKYIDYVGEGMRTNNWTATTKKYYGFSSLSDLQLTWLEWVRHGSQNLPDGQLPEALLVSAQPPSAGIAEARGNVGQTQMASLAVPTQSRVAPGALASWQTTQSQNARVFEEGREYATPLAQPASSARPAVTAEQPAEDRNTASRPFSEGWYARRRDQAQASLKSSADKSAANPVTPVPTSASTENEASALGSAPQDRPGIQAVPASSIAPTKADRRVLMEWSRPEDHPYRPGAALTGVAMRDSATNLR